MTWQQPKHSWTLPFMGYPQLVFLCPKPSPVPPDNDARDPVPARTGRQANFIVPLPRVLRYAAEVQTLVEDFLQYLRHERGQSDNTAKTYAA